MSVDQTDYLRDRPFLTQVVAERRQGGGRYRFGQVNPLVTGAEDFSYFALETPGLFVFLGITPEGQDPAKAPSNHSPFFYADEAALKTGTELYVNWVLDYPGQ